MCNISGGGGTLAYFNSRHTNVTSLSTDIYQTRVTDTFTSPENWLPGTEVNHEMKLTNTGDIKVAVRAKIEQSWTSANGDELSFLQPNYTINKLNNENGYAIEGNCNKSVLFYSDYHEQYTSSSINLYQNIQNIEDADSASKTYCESYEYTSSVIGSKQWEVKANTTIENWDGYFYYSYYLDPHNSTEPIITKMMFNPEITNDLSCTTSNGVETCTSTGDGYDGATYTLKVTFETVQYDKYQDFWDTDFQIETKPYYRKFETNIINLNSVTAGDAAVNPISITNTSDKMVMVRALIKESLNGEILNDPYQNLTINYSEDLNNDTYWQTINELFNNTLGNGQSMPTNDGYLYYYKLLQPNETITNFIDSLSFEENDNKSYKLDTIFEMVDIEYYDDFIGSPWLSRFLDSYLIKYNLTFTNNESEKVAIRASITDKWIDELSNEEIPDIMQINSYILVNRRLDNNRWTYENGYYYCLQMLDSGGSFSFRNRHTLNIALEYFTYHPHLSNSYDSVQQKDTIEITFDELPNVKYVMEIQYETAFENEYQTLWDTNIEIN